MISLDHIIFGVPELNRAVDDFYQKSGVRPSLGGKHPTLGTHNALVSLGKSYFEFLSADPTRDLGVEVGIEALKDVKTPHLIGWALQCTDFEAVENSLKPYHMHLSPIGAGSRKTLDDTILKYEFATLIGATGPDGAIPFFVKWIETVHTSLTSPTGCQLECFSVSKNISGNFLEWAKNESLNVNLTTGASLEMKIKTPKGVLQFA